MAVCNPSTLLSDGKAFQSLSKRELQIVIVQLLCDISNGNGGGTTSGAGNPTGVVFPTTSTALYVDTVTGDLYIWYSSSWHLFSGGGSGVSYLAYVALLSESDGDPPVATVMENTLGGAVIWTYNSPGQYIGTLSGAFTANKTFVIIGGVSYNNGDGGLPIMRASRIDVNTIGVGSFSTGDTAFEDNLMSNIPIEIRVYP